MTHRQGVLFAVFLWSLAMLCIHFCGCGGDAFTPLFDPSFPTSPGLDGGPSEDHLAGSDDARSPGLDAASAGEFRGEGADIAPADGTPEAGESDAPYPRDVLADPWPEDVVVERVPPPPPNCFVDFGGNLACCFPRNQPPVDCELQNQPQFCPQCPR